MCSSILGLYALDANGTSTSTLFPYCDNQKYLQTLPNIKAKSPLTESHWTGDGGLLWATPARERPNLRIWFPVQLRDVRQVTIPLGLSFLISKMEE